MVIFLGKTLKSVDGDIVRVRPPLAPLLNTGIDSNEGTPPLAPLISLTILVVDFFYNSLFFNGDYSPALH